MYRSYMKKRKSEANERNTYFYFEGKLRDLLKGTFDPLGSGVDIIFQLQILT